MSVKMQPTSVIKARLGIEPNGRIQKFFTEECYRAMDDFVPKDKGDLRTIVDLESNSITYESPYAKYQYYGQREDGTHKINPANYTTPGTGPYWDKRMVSSKMDQVVKAVQNEINRGGK